MWESVCAHMYVIVVLCMCGCMLVSLINRLSQEDRFPVLTTHWTSTKPKVETIFTLCVHLVGLGCMYVVWLLSVFWYLLRLVCGFSCFTLPFFHFENSNTFCYCITVLKQAVYHCIYILKKGKILYLRTFNFHCISEIYIAIRMQITLNKCKYILDILLKIWKFTVTQNHLNFENSIINKKVIKLKIIPATIAYCLFAHQKPTTHWPPGKLRPAVCRHTHLLYRIRTKWNTEKLDFLTWNQYSTGHY